MSSSASLPSAPTTQGVLAVYADQLAAIGISALATWIALLISRARATDATERARLAGERATMRPQIYGPELARYLTTRYRHGGNSATLMRGTVTIATASFKLDGFAQDGLDRGCVLSC
jgi:hypothetical protein